MDDLAKWLMQYAPKVPRTDWGAPPNVYAPPTMKPPPSDDRPFPSHLTPWHGGNMGNTPSLFDHDEPSQGLLASPAKDPRNTMRRAGDIGWSTFVQPNLTTPQAGAMPGMSLDWNPLQDRKQFGLNARWRHQF